MLIGLLEGFKASLELIGLAGLVLDAAGALLVLGPEIPTVANLATHFERKRMHNLLDKLEMEGELDEGVNSFHKLYNVKSYAPKSGFEVDEMRMREDKVVFHCEGLERGDRISRPIDVVRDWISDYPGVDREYYLAGGGLLLTGFLFQIVSQSAKINVVAGVASLIVAVFVALYLFYRAWRSIGWGSPILALLTFRG